MSRVELNTPAPNFTLNDFNGKSVSLVDFANQKNVVVVFNRGFFDLSAARTWRSCAKIISNS